MYLFDWQRLGLGLLCYLDCRAGLFNIRRWDVHSYLACILNTGGQLCDKCVCVLHLFVDCSDHFCFGNGVSALGWGSLNRPLGMHCRSSFKCRFRDLLLSCDSVFFLFWFTSWSVEAAVWSTLMFSFSIVSCCRCKSIWGPLRVFGCGLRQGLRHVESCLQKP